MVGGTRLEVFPGWRAADAVLLPALRELYSYDERHPDRATGWLYSTGPRDNLPPMSWPEPLAVAGPLLLDDLKLTTGVVFAAVCFQAYLDGAGTSWHHDRDWDAQAIVSLGDTRLFGIRNGEDERYLQLAHGDMIFMPSGFQQEWEHCVPVEEVTGERCSLVFRSAVIE